LNAAVLHLLENQIDIKQVPFSDRGSRLLVYHHADKPALYIKLAERLIHYEAGIESYLKRPPLIEKLEFIDEDGKVLDFKTSSSAEMLRFETNIGEIQIVFQDEKTLSFGVPSQTVVGMRFQIRSLKWLNGKRDAFYQVSNGKIMKNQKQGLNVELMIESQDDCALTLHIGNDDSFNIKPFSIAKHEAQTRWQKWFDMVPPVCESRREKYAYAWWVMANNLVSPNGFVKYETMMPTKAFYVGAWLWDSALHALAFRHVDVKLAQNQIRAMVANQLEDGMLPDAIFDEGVVSEIHHPIHARVTKPPIMAWAALKLYETNNDIEFLKEIYEPLKRENAWWFEHNDDDNDGIVQYTHPYSSGLDNSPLWDFGMPVESPDINTYLILQMNTLAEISKLLRKHDEAALLKNKADELTQRIIEHLWDEEAGIFHALHNEKPIPVLTPFNLYPLWISKLPKKINEKLLAHLTNPNKFWGRFGLPTVAFDDATYSENKMWRGPVWANINYFFIEALQKIGEVELAKELRTKTLDLIASQPGIREYYNAKTGEAPATAAPIFGWSAAVFIELAIQEYKESRNN